MVHTTQRETVMSAELAELRAKLTSSASVVSHHEVAISKELQSAQGMAALSAQREMAQYAEMRAVQDEITSARWRETSVMNELGQMRQDLMQMQGERERDRANARDEVSRVTEKLRRQYLEERAQWHARSGSTTRSPLDEPPGLPRSTACAYMSAEGVLIRNACSGNAPPDPPPGASSLSTQAERNNNPAVNLMCGGAPPPPPPPGGDSEGGGIQSGCVHGCVHEQCGRWRGDRHGRSDGDGGSSELDGLYSATGVGAQYRRSEAATITIAAIPPPSQFRSWRMNTLREIAAASLFPECCYSWILRVESDDELNDSSPFGSIDGKVISALNKVLSGELLRQVQTTIESDGRA
eukprot:6128568-Amphidinium_carterae.2